MLVHTCVRCHEPLTEDAEVCPACGYDMTQQRLPEPTETRAVVEWRGAMPGLLQGVALAGASVALRYVLPRAAGYAARRVIHARRTSVARSRALMMPPETLKYVSETRIIRRVWSRD